MTIEEKLAMADKKIEQAKHRRLLQQNRNVQKKHKQEEQMRFRVGEMFLEQFPFIKELLTPYDEYKANLLQKYMEALANMHRAYEEIDDEIGKMEAERQ